MIVAASRATVFTAMSVLLVVSPLGGQAVTPWEDDRWHFDISPFGQLTAVSGVVKAGGETVDLGSSSLSNGLFGLHVEVLRKGWVILAEGSYLKYGVDGETPDGTPARLDLTQTMGEGAIGYSFGSVSRSFAFLGGARYLNIKGETTVQGGQTQSGSEGIWDPYLGLRFHFNANPRIPLTLRADVGGFQIADVKNSWRVTIGAGFHVADRIWLAGGWRWYDVEYKSDSTVDQIIYDVKQHGPFLALTLGI
ncbi:MAG: hypothetical protein JSW51_12225 [Gemmatimonadota bacterium]|nr:MAG: hypothetical protein JSW51_12225 [Gemmatimonadota bacterium]